MAMCQVNKRYWIGTQQYAFLYVDGEGKTAAVWSARHASTCAHATECGQDIPTNMQKQFARQVQELGKGCMVLSSEVRLQLC